MFSVTESSFLTDSGDDDRHRKLAEAVSDVSTALSSTLELDDVLDLIMERVARVVPYSFGSVLLVQDETVEVMSARGYDDSIIGVQLPLTALTRGLIDTSEPVVVKDTRTDPGWVTTEAAAHIRSAVVVAIHADGEVIGFISLDSTEVSSFTLDQARQLQVFADQAGNAIRNARLYQEARDALAAMREQRRLTQVLADISAELTVQREVDDLLDFILERISTFVVGASVSVLLITDGMAEVMRTSRGDEKLLGTRLAVTDTATLREASATRRPYLIADTQAAESEWMPSDETAATRSNLTAPILLNDEVIGFLSLSSDQPDAFPAALFQPLETFSNHVGVALHNARMFAESKSAQSAEREERIHAEALGEVSAALNRTLELDELLDVILDRAGRVVPFSTGTVLMFDGDHAEVVRAKGFDSPIEGFRLPLADARNLERVAQTGEPSFINDTQSSPDWIRTPENEHIRSDMTVAIRADGEFVGAIAVDSEEKDAFTIEQLRRLETFAEQAGNAVRNARLYQESQSARQQSERLLRAMLPERIAEELKSTGSVRARRLDDVAVLFADIVGFTRYSDTHDPGDVLVSLTQMMERFEDIARAQSVEKLKTIGDSFMAAAGLLAPTLNPDLQCVKAGLEMIEACRDLESEWTVRVGVHSGELVAGVLGREKFLFDIWGDTVNTASRVESSGVPGKVSVSRVTWDRISHAVRGRSRGLVSLKGKGDMETFVIDELR